jgi:Tol biopolymer transport system component
VQFAKGGAVSGAPGWSPDGSLLAAVFDHRLKVFTAAGKRVLSIRLGTRRGCGDVVWANSHRVVLGGFDRSSGFNPPKCRVMSVDVRTHTMSSAPDSWFGTRSADGKVATFAARIDGGHFAIGITPTSGGAPTIYANVPACALASLQFAGPSRSLVFNTACGNPSTDLYSVEPDGSGLEQVTTGAHISDPALSPDGTGIAYSGDLPDGGIGIRDSTGATVDIAPPPAKECHALAGETYTPPDSWPSWSPDGNSIVFVRPDCSWQNEIYTVPAGGGNPQGLGLQGIEPAWGPTRIAFAGLFGGIATANPDGTDPVQISVDGTYPAWSADGRLAYLAGNANTTVVVGATQTPLPFMAVTSLTWSPDGTRFLVTARTTQTGPFDLYTVNTDGSDPVQLTQNYDALAAAWR